MLGHFNSILVALRVSRKITDMPNLREYAESSELSAFNTLLRRCRSPATSGIFERSKIARIWGWSLEMQYIVIASIPV
jgi:hypothetical protein